MSERTSDAPLMDSVYLDRWSPRSFTDQAVSDDQLAAVFEAARWTPSWMNNQPWYFVYETDGAAREDILGTFMEFNRDWAAKAPVVGLVLARTELEDFMARTRDFDTGAACMALTLQATTLGLSVHLLGGVDVEAAHALTGTSPDNVNVLCGFVLGHRGPIEALPDKLQERESPSPRKPASDFAIRGLDLPESLTS